MTEAPTYCLSCDSEDCRCGALTPLVGTVESSAHPDARAESARQHRRSGAAPTLAHPTPAPRPKPHLPPLGNLAVGRSEIVKISASVIAAEPVEEIPTLPFLGRSGYILELRTSLIASFPKGGKTTLMVPVTKEWLANGHRLLYISEEARGDWRARLSGDGWDGMDFIFGLAVPPRDLFNAAFTGDHDVVIIDTLRNVIQLEDETDNSKIARQVNPWIAKARETRKTLILCHHETKAGGEYGRALAGGHALLASVDAALEIHRVPGVPNRRVIRAIARHISPEDLLYEKDGEGTIRALGEARSVEVNEVVKRLPELLTDEWQSRSQIIEAMDDPRPGAETIRQALSRLVSSGKVERDPSDDKKGATYRYRNLPTATLSLGGRSGPGVKP